MEILDILILGWIINLSIIFIAYIFNILWALFFIFYYAKPQIAIELKNKVEALDRLGKYIKSTRQTKWILHVLIPIVLPFANILKIPKFFIFENPSSKIDKLMIDLVDEYDFSEEERKRFL